mgnify:CR=1 FL=1
MFWNGSIIITQQKIQNMEQYSLDTDKDYPIIKTMPKGKFLGVCAWLGHKFNIDVIYLRLIFVLTFIFGFGSPLIVYIILAMVKPVVD